MTYTVYYKRPGVIFWKKLRDVVGDGFVFLKDAETRQVIRFPMRYFMLTNKTRVELPLTLLFKFSPERFLDEQEKMSKEAGTEIKTDGKNQSRKK